MSKEITLSIPLPKAKQAFQKQLQQSKTIEGKLYSSNRFRLNSTANYGNANMINKFQYHISGNLEAIDNKTKITYRITGNDTFTIFIVPILLAIVPACIIPLNRSMGINRNPESEIILAAMLGILAFILMLHFLVLSRRLKRDGERDFDVFLSTLTSIY